MSLAQLTLLPLLLLEPLSSLLLVLADPTSLLSSPVQSTLHVSWCMLAALLLLVLLLTRLDATSSGNMSSSRDGWSPAGRPASSTLSGALVASLVACFGTTNVTLADAGRMLRMAGSYKS